MTQKRKRDYKAEYRARMERAKAETGESYNVARRSNTGKGTPTGDTYAGFQMAYAYFNRKLFGGELPELMITLRTFGKAKGYFSPHRFANLATVTTIHEIALDPRQFMDRTPIEVLSTLVHEMCHVKQMEQGSPSRNGYHNAEWAAMMHEVGLHPSDIAAPGGKETGQKVSHYIVEGGRFEVEAKKLIDNKKFQLAWVDVEGFLLTPAKPGSPAAKLAPAPKPKGKSGKRTKYTCEDCGNSVWGKDLMELHCTGTVAEPHHQARMAG